MDTHLDFDGTTVLITGAAGNLGAAVARAFAARGARLALVDLDEAALRRTFGEPGGLRLFVGADLLQPAAADAAAARAVAHFGRIDVLCNLAGGFRMGEAVHETSAATWDLMLGLNARTVLHMAHAVVPGMLAPAAKSAVIRLTEALSAELREQHVNVNCVLPTIIDTPENRAAMPDADPARWVAPADLAAVIVFLASDAARAVHGAALPVTGLS
jgi:NAD(P)-dependent dehydrogenase (short-subunit alcohol dehydrogenase family)